MDSFCRCGSGCHLGQNEEGSIIGGLGGIDGVDSLDSGTDGDFDDGYDGGFDGFESKQRRDNWKRRSSGSQRKMTE